MNFSEITSLTYDPRLRTLHTDTKDSTAVTIGRSH